MNLRRLFITVVISVFASLAILAQNPKREFRGAWIHTVFQEQYARQNTQQNKQYLRDQLDKLKAAGVNAILFQVRPSADAFYKSKYEPWSRFLTQGGKAPEPYWDPLEFIVEEAHARGMELHAWLNPYRVTTSKNEVLPKNHIYYKHPERFVKYADGKMYFDPGLPENQQFIADVVMDIINNYDIDGIHFDDYFYPYPVSGAEFPDNASYAKYGNGMNRGDWRRQNVDQLIELIHNEIIMSDKPWVRFGISPFGIWRNKKSDPRGSDTNGLQNYDALYADVLLWAEQGWIDYLLPQLYWEIENPRASYATLVKWWDQAVDPKCQLYIGQDVERTMNKPDLDNPKKTNQLDAKMEMMRCLPNVQGNCWWPAYSLTKNFKESATALKKTWQSTPALVPAYTTMSKEMPDPVVDFKLHGNTLTWDVLLPMGVTSDAVKFVVYHFPKGVEPDFENPQYILDIIPDTKIKVTEAGSYAVTALDRVNNESEPSEIIIVK